VQQKKISAGLERRRRGVRNAWAWARRQQGAIGVLCTHWAFAQVSGGGARQAWACGRAAAGRRGAARAPRRETLYRV